MLIINLKNPRKPLTLENGCGLCLGHFDGVHTGHRALIRELQRINALRDSSLPLGALCFTTPPASVLSDTPVPQITTLEQKLMLLRGAGLRFAILYEFADIRNISPEDFVKDILFKECGCRMAVCGYNYSFGAGGAGKAADLKRIFESVPGRVVSVVDPVQVGGRTVSSTLIRGMLEEGHPEEAARMLGHPFFLMGKVASGHQLGRQMEIPTANLEFPEGILIPRHGVYAASARIGRRTYQAVTNIGTRPTFYEDNHVTAETYIFDFKGDLYGKTLQVSLLRFLRPEKRFSNQRELEAQMHEDILKAKSVI